MHPSSDRPVFASTGLMRRVLLPAAVALILVLPFPAFAANVNIPTFQLLTRGIMEGGQFSLQTAGEIEITFGGGYKFGGQLSLGLSGTNLEEPAGLPDSYDDTDVAALAADVESLSRSLDTVLDRTLTFRSARVIVRDTFGAPFDTTYFIGELDRLLNGEIFPSQFGSEIVASDFRGILYFPPPAVEYDGIHVIDGTGLSLSSGSLAPWLYLQAAIYQDSALSAAVGVSRYSTDLRAAFNVRGFKAEAFAGASFPVASYGAYRGGLLLFYNTGQGGEFLTQIGIPYWEPPQTVTIDDFYFLFEPRVYIGFMSIVLTLFSHPEYYEQQQTGEGTATDIAVRLIAGNVQENLVSGGLENRIKLRPNSTDTLRVSVAPFVSVNASGVIWDMKADVKVFPWELDSLFEAYIGIRTEF